MKRLLNLLILSSVMLFTACSEDVNPDPVLAGPLYGLQKGEPGSVDELIYNTWEYCGVYYLYDYDEYAFQLTNWGTAFEKWYTPVLSENKELIREVIDRIQNHVFAGMDGEFIRKNWYVRVFLCDSLCDNYEYSAADLVDDYLENSDLLIIPNIGEVMKNYTDEDWNTWEKKFSDLLISRLYLGASEEPEEFFDMRYKDPRTGKDGMMYFASKWKDDPEEEYTKNVYSFRTLGYWRSKPTPIQVESAWIVDRAMDVADYITNLTNLPKSELEHTWQRFPRMLERTRAIVPYLENVLGLDLVGMHNANCPSDPVEAGYYDNL